VGSNPTPSAKNVQLIKRDFCRTIRNYPQICPQDFFGASVKREGSDSPSRWLALPPIRQLRRRSLNVTWSGYYSDQIAASAGSGYNIESRIYGKIIEPTKSPINSAHKLVQHDYRQDRSIALPNPSCDRLRCWFHDHVAAILSSRRLGGHHSYVSALTCPNTFLPSAS
jgi:hypothetical protein